MKLKKEMQDDFPKMGVGGGGPKAVWNFSENSSFLVAPAIVMVSLICMEQKSVYFSIIDFSCILSKCL